VVSAVGYRGAGVGVWAKTAWGAALFAIFLAIVLWFNVVDFYHRHFFDHGIVVLVDNLARIGFLLVLSWLIYAPGAAVAQVLLPGAHRAELTPMERSVLAFGIGIGLWHVLLLIMGVAGLYYRSIMVGLAAIVLLASARHFGTVASAACRILATRAAGLRRGVGIPEALCIVLVVVCGIWLLLVRGLYPGGGGDYYTHYFYYYLDVLKNHDLAPNDVWYHYFYSKGYGLFFLGMLLTDPEAPALATFCCVIFAAVAMAVLAQRIAPRSLWPACVAALYLLFNVIGDARADPRAFDLPALHVTVTKNGVPLSEGYGSAVQGSPLQAVAWLANTLGTYGITLDAGDVILSGSLVPLEPAKAGDLFDMELHGIGRCAARFV